MGRSWNTAPIYSGYFDELNYEIANMSSLPGESAYWMGRRAEAHGTMPVPFWHIACRGAADRGSAFGADHNKTYY